MKGLCLNSVVNKKELGLTFVRKGLKLNLRSHVCWHVFGLVHRSNLNYSEAIKCYQNALKIDVENLQIMRDLYILQIQLRDLKGFATTRRMVLTLRPQQRPNWIGYAIAHHLLGNLSLAIDVLDQFLDTMETGRVVTYEESEILFYRIDLMEQLGHFQAALDYIHSHTDSLFDIMVRKQKVADLECKLAHYDVALRLYEELLDENADDFAYHRGAQCCLLQDASYLTSLSQCDLPSDSFFDNTSCVKKKKTLISFYDRRRCKLAAKKEFIWQRIPLNFTQGDELLYRLDRYLRAPLRRGVPSLGSDLKFLSMHPTHSIVFETLLLSYVKSLQLCNEKDAISCFPVRLGQVQLDENPDDFTFVQVELPMTLLWTLYLLAQHYDRKGQYNLAMGYIDQCIDHTPTILDFYQKKGKILKHMGDLTAAADIMIFARTLDLADRYINNKATAYLLHNDRMTEAQDTIALFTKHEGSEGGNPNPQQNLFDMQCMWYELLAGRSYMRTLDFGQALKKFVAVEKHFLDIQDDQLDFHSYCMRKVTLRSYLDLLGFGNVLFDHTFFKQAAHGAIDCYVTIYDQRTKDAADVAEKEANMSKNDKLKAKRDLKKARKAEFKKNEQLGIVPVAENGNASIEKEKENVKGHLVVDDDPVGDKLLATSAPLEEARRFVNLLLQYSPQDISSHFAAFEIAFREQKVVVCLRALHQSSELLKNNMSLAEDKAKWTHCVVRLFAHLETSAKFPNASIQNLVESERKKYLGKSDTIKDYVLSLLAQVTTKAEKEMGNFYQRLAVAKCLLTLDKVTFAQQIQDLFLAAAKDATLSVCQSMYKTLQAETVALPKVAKLLLTVCTERFPMSSFFNQAALQ